MPSTNNSQLLVRKESHLAGRGVSISPSLPTIIEESRDINSQELVVDSKEVNTKTNILDQPFELQPMLSNKPSYVGSCVNMFDLLEISKEFTSDMMRAMIPKYYNKMIRLEAIIIDLDSANRLESTVPMYLDARTRTLVTKIRNSITPILIDINLFSRETGAFCTMEYRLQRIQLTCNKSLHSGVFPYHLHEYLREPVSHHLSSYANPK